MLDYEDARALVFEIAKPLEKCLCNLIESQGMVVSEDIIAPHGIPLFDNSAVDGYAVKAADIEEASKKNPVRLENLGYISAGETGEEPIISGKCVKIATGAPLPNGADATVMKENIKVEATHVNFFEAIPKMENIRYQGEDIEQGEIVITAGTVIGPAQMAVLATFGFSQVPVHRTPKISIISTGSELVNVEQKPQKGQIRESNRYMLSGMIKQESCELVKMSMVPDTPEILRKEFDEALKCDVTIVSGGMSVGDKDFAKHLLKEMATMVSCIF